MSRQRIVRQRLPSLRRAIAAAVAAAAIYVAFGHVASAQQPERPVTQRPEAVWTPSAEAPAGVLSHALEGQRHDHFIDLAQKGDIDLVFFGTTATEMWWWPNRGRAAWDQAFGSLKAANFGSQGSHFESLVWRMRNGELDGYRAKLFVLQFGPGDSSIDDAFAPERHAEFVAGYASVIAEIRARQPQAKILLLAGFPRGQSSREPWREIADMNAAVFAELTDDETVFYADIGERFFLPDGSFNREMWAMPGPAGVGAQQPALRGVGGRASALARSVRSLTSLAEPTWPGVHEHVGHRGADRRSTPSTFESSRSNVPTGTCPALRAVSTTRQSEKPSVGRCLK